MCSSPRCNCRRRSPQPISSPATTTSISEPYALIFRLARKDRRGLRVGICWRGHPRHFDLTRSIPLDLFASLFQVPDVDFVVLLNSLTAEEESILGGMDRVEIPRISDFLDLAAAIGTCDLVVSVDTAVPHLAAAGGVPVLLLSRPDACWRWGVAEDSPWYEAVEVLRHGGDMDWPGVLAEAAARIGRLGAVPMRLSVGS